MLGLLRCRDHGYTGGKTDMEDMEGSDELALRGEMHGLTRGLARPSAVSVRSWRSCGRRIIRQATKVHRTEDGRFRRSL